jgi:hypothetical protein
MEIKSTRNLFCVFTLWMGNAEMQKMIEWVQEIYCLLEKLLVAFAVLVLLAHPVCLLTHDVKCNPAVT